MVLGSEDPTYVPTYAEFDSDIDMRTIFTDSSVYVNPRHLTALKRTEGNLTLFSMSGSLNATGSLSNFGAGVFEGINGQPIYPATPYQRSYPSPNFYIRIAMSATASNGSPLLANVTGANVPWFLDFNIPPFSNYFQYSNAFNNFSNFLPWTHEDGSQEFGQKPGASWGSSDYPQPGWLTGGTVTDYDTAADGEFPTTGMQIGPPDIKPVYPLLDDISVEKNTTISPLADYLLAGKKYAGIRPGLRGSEINGKWELLIANAVAVSGSGGNAFFIPGSGVWFRQFRLEFLIEKNNDLDLTPQTLKRYSKTSTVPKNKNKRLLEIMSGSAAANITPGVTGNFVNISDTWDMGTNSLYAVDLKEEYGRSIGITDNTGSNVYDYAIITTITGSLYNSLTGTLAIDEYLNNEFGTPFIPISSGSAQGSTFLALTSDDAVLSKLFINEILNQKTKLSRSQILQSILNRNNYVQSSLQKRTQFLNETYSGSI